MVISSEKSAGESVGVPAFLVRIRSTRKLLSSTTPAAVAVSITPTWYTPAGRFGPRLTSWLAVQLLKLRVNEVMPRSVRTLAATDSVAVLVMMVVSGLVADRKSVV